MDLASFASSGDRLCLVSADEDNVTPELQSWSLPAAILPEFMYGLVDQRPCPIFADLRSLVDRINKHWDRHELLNYVEFQPFSGSIIRRFMALDDCLLDPAS